MYHLAATSDQSNIVNRERSEHSELQGWSYAVLVRFMGGSYHHIGGSVGSHLPEIQQHAQSWTSVHVCGRPWAPVSKHIMSRYGVLPWLWPPSKAWLVDPMIGLSRHVKDLTSPHSHVMQQHPQVGGSGGLRTHRIRVVGGGLYQGCIAPIFMLPCCPMLHGSSVGGGVLHGIA